MRFAAPHAPARRNCPTVQPRWGKIGKQKIQDDGELCPKRMETIDDEILANAMTFLDKAKSDGKPFFLWLNPTRMHVVTHLSPKYEALRTPENGWSIEEAGMAQLDDIVGATMQKLKDMGVATTPSSFSPPITEPKTSPGRTADKLHSPAARVQHSKEVSDARRLFAGQARCLLERLRTEYSLASTGSRRS
jgi:Sulfatase